MAQVGALPTVLDREGSPVAELRARPARSTVAPPWRNGHNLNRRVRLVRDYRLPMPE
jgi:hypothetical protein